MKKSIMLLGSTGSVGLQAADVARAQNYDVRALCANKNFIKVEEQIREFGVKSAAMTDIAAAAELKLRTRDLPVRIYSGHDGICQMIADTEADLAVNSIIGTAGLLPTLAVIDSGKDLALANKESLVIAGKIVMDRACLRSGSDNEIKSLIITASGGPFFGKKRNELLEITREQALAHPTWKMGAKITIDSATLMNKGFEVIEAVHLFGVRPDQVKVVVHRESIIHSAVEYIDNSVIAQMSVPDMRHCVQYALTYPDRMIAETKPLDLFEVGKLSFAKPDTETFVLLSKAYEAIEKGGALPAVLNAANEEAVAAFLDKKIGFYDIVEVVSGTLDKYSSANNVRDLDEILAVSREARITAGEIISSSR